MIPFRMITLDKPRKLRFGMAASVEFEQITGIKVTQIEDEMSIETMAKLIWVMLKQEDKELTLEQTIALIDEHAESMTDVLKAVTDAISAAFNTGEKSPNA